MVRFKVVIRKSQAISLQDSDFFGKFTKLLLNIFKLSFNLGSPRADVNMKLEFL